MAAPESDIPVGTMFTPGTIHLPSFLEAAIRHSGGKAALLEAVNNIPVQTKAPKAPKTPRMQRLPLEAAVQYGLLEEKTWVATDLCKELAGMKEGQLYDAFARHILLNCNGLRVVDGAQEMALDEHITHVSVTGDSLAEYLCDQGLRVTIHNVAINAMRGWLAKAGIFPQTKQDAWVVDQASKERVLGLSRQQIAAIAGWAPEHRALVLAICRMDRTGKMEGAEVREAAEAELGHRLPRSSLPKMFQPLAEAGFIAIDPSGTQSGKSMKFRVLPDFDKEVLEDFLENATEQLDSSVLELYKVDPAKIKQDLLSEDTYVKGIALEAYAVRLMRLLGLRFLRWRERSAKTGGAEVDIILGGIYGGIPTRWQVQCKNTPKGQVRVGEVAKEVGLAVLTKATHIVIIANAAFTPDAYRFAKAVMENSSLTVYLLGDKEFKRVLESSSGELAAILREQGERIVAQVTRKGLEWLPED